MLSYTRIAVIAYTFAVFSAGYLAVAMIRDMVTDASRMRDLSMLSATTAENDHTTLTFDGISPAAGAN